MIVDVEDGEGLAGVDLRGRGLKVGEALSVGEEGHLHAAELCFAGLGEGGEGYGECEGDAAD